MSSFKRICFIVLDSVGIGEAPDAAGFGDVGAHTLGHILERNPGLKLPNMQRLGLANIAPCRRLSRFRHRKAIMERCRRFPSAKIR